MKAVEFLSIYDYVVITHIPVFYKINLYNELAKRLNIFVVFISLSTDEKRADDFVGLDNINFDFKVLNNGIFQSRSKFRNINKLKIALKEISYQKIIISGWDLLEFWYLVFKNSKNKNCLALESTILDSHVKSIKGFVKKIFLSRISIVFSSGNLHIELLKALNYKNEIRRIKGVGIINKPSFDKKDSIYSKKFLFIGRLSKVKNLELLIKVFNDLKEHQLTIIGTGENENHLKSIANKNTIFEGFVNNKKLKKYFLESDIFILPSVKEPWGLVVEEALYFGLPVIVSKNCGCVELVEHGVNGYIINPKDSKNINDVIFKIDDKRYKKLLSGVKKVFIENKDFKQIEIYTN